MWLMLWQRPPSKFMSLLRAIGAHKRKSSLHNLTISPLSHPLSLQTPNKRWNNDGKFWGEKRLGFEKKPACVWVGGGGYKLAAKLCHKASQSPPAAKPLLTRLSNFRPSFRPARSKGFLNNVQNCRIGVLGHPLPGAGTCIMPWNYLKIGNHQFCLHHQCFKSRSLKLTLNLITGGSARMYDVNRDFVSSIVDNLEVWFWSQRGIRL